MVATGKTSLEHDNKISKLSFSNIYSAYLNKISKKGRTEEELKLVITWLTGYEGDVLNDFIHGEETLKDFFDKANLNPNSKYVNLGDWITYYTYGVFDGETMKLKEY